MKKNRGVQNVEAGKFLANWGKTLTPRWKTCYRLVNCGKENFLSKEKRILEVMCNRGTNSNELAQRFAVR